MLSIKDIKKIPKIKIGVFCYVYFDEKHLNIIFYRFLDDSSFGNTYISLTQQSHISR